MPGPDYRCDLRSGAIECKRDRECKQKWGPYALKGQRRERADTPATSNKPRPYNQREMPTPRPVQFERLNYARARSRWQKTDMLQDPKDNIRGSAAALCCTYSDPYLEEGPAKIEDDRVMYSFDAPSGPVDGEKILSQALHLAEARFEDHQTTKLVNAEYDLVDADDERDFFIKPPNLVDDDFEMI